MPLRVVETRQVLQIITIFMIVQFFGLFMSSEIYSGATYQEITNAQIVTSAVSALFYIVYIVIFAAIIILIMKIYKGDKFFYILEGAVIFITSFFVFMILSGLVINRVLFTVSGSQITTSFIIGIVAAVWLIVLKNKIPKLRNATAIIASVGVGLVLGISFSFLVAFIFMAILAVYDFIAVFVTKHMVTMANALGSRNLAFLVGVSEVEALPKSEFTKRELSDYQKEMKGVKMSPELKKMYKSGMLPVPARMELGAGDLAVPLMLAVAAYKVFLNFALSFFIIIGAVGGLVLAAYIVKRYQRMLPAIPLLLFGISVGISAYALVFGLVPL